MFDIGDDFHEMEPAISTQNGILNLQGDVSDITITSRTLQPVSLELYRSADKDSYQNEFRFVELPEDLRCLKKQVRSLTVDCTNFQYGLENLII